MEDKNAFKQFFSIQPFWPAQADDSQIIYDDYINTTFQVQKAMLKKQPLDTVPGIGLITLLFSCNPNHPQAYCYGVLENRQMLPNHIGGLALRCRLQPGAFSRIFHMDSSCLTNKDFSLFDIINAKDLAEQIALAVTLEKQTLLLQTFFRKQYQQSPKKNEVLLAQHIVDLIEQAHGNIRIQELSNQTGYSARYIQQVMSSCVGTAPKQLCQNVRFQHGLAMLATGTCTLSDLAIILGYYDQSHFNKDFKSVINAIPSELLQTGLLSTPLSYPAEKIL